MEDVEERPSEETEGLRASEEDMEECECVNYYPGFVSDCGEEQLDEFERTFENQFFMRC